MRTRLAPFALPLAAALGLAACAEPEEETYTTDVEDQSGGELIVEERDPDAVPADVPDVPMTPIPPAQVPPEQAPGQDVPPADTTGE